MNAIKFTVVAAFVFLLFPLRGKGQRVEIYTDQRSNTYAAINLVDMPRNVEDRNANDSFYTEVQLFETDETTPVTGTDGGKVYVKRITRHYTNGTNIQDPDKNLSRRFILSSQLISSDGTTPSPVGAVTWAQANGYLSTANSQRFIDPPTASAAMTGCSAYQGKDGQDTKGTWRVPTHREGAIIIAFQKELEATRDETGFVTFSRSSTTTTQYWLATEFYGSTDAWYMSFATVATDNSLNSKSKNTYYYLRCIRDIEVE